MKQIFIILTFLISVSFSQAQSALTITSNNENVRFCVVIGEQQMHDFFETKVEIENIPAGYHYVRIVFEADSVADLYKNIQCSANTRRTFVISERSEKVQEIRGKTRNAGEKREIGEHDSSFKYLVEIYKMDLAEKTSFTSTETEISVSTDNSLSTSILPVNKAKK